MIGDHLIKASVQYNDIVGTIAADLEHSVINLDEFLVNRNFDSRKYFPFSFAFEFGEPSPNSKRSTWFKIYAVEKDVVGNNHKELIDYLDKNDNNLSVYEFYFDLAPDDFFDLFKRFNITFSDSAKSESYYRDTINKNTINEVRI